MKISKIPIPGSTRLVEIAYEDTTAVVYFLDENGEIVDHLTVEDTSVVELKQLLPFMFIIAVTPQQQWEVSCAGMYNQIFEPCMNSIFSPLAWEMSKELVDCIREFGKCKQVYNYKNTLEYAEVYEKTINLFVYGKQTFAEEEYPEVFERAVQARIRMLILVEKLVL